MNYIHQIEELAPILKNADHIDVKVITGDVSMKTFIAAMLGYQPKWMDFLYFIRKGFVRLLGMKQEGIPQAPKLRPEDVPMEAGKAAYFFRVEMAKEEQYWFACADDKHLKAYLGVVVEPIAGDLNRFHVVTVVHYKHWTGPVYFNTIRPFHHLVVHNMTHAGVSARI